MTTHDKILLAGDLLVDAANTYKSATSSAEYAKSILLSGAVIGIIAPWLEELDIKSSQIMMAEFSAKLRGINLSSLSECEQRKIKGKSIGFYRLTYNSLKHSGHYGKIKASDDLIFEADLKEEAYYLIASAIDDYNKLPLSQNTINFKLSSELLTLLQSAWQA